MTTEATATPLDTATSALYAAALQAETAAENARILHEQLAAAATSARAAYENAAIHTSEPRCGHTKTTSWGASVLGPCARPAEHPEEYHRNAGGTQVWRKEPATARTPA